jgi:hypothetical protein
MSAIKFNRTPVLHVYASMCGTDRERLLANAAGNVNSISRSLSWQYINFSTNDATGVLQYNLLFIVVGAERDLRAVAALAKDEGRLFAVPKATPRLVGSLAVAPLVEPFPKDPWETWSVEFRIQDVDRAGIVLDVAKPVSEFGGSFESLHGQVKRDRFSKVDEFWLKGSVWCPTREIALRLETELQRLPFSVHQAKAIAPTRESRRAG